MKRKLLNIWQDWKSTLLALTLIIIFRGSFFDYMYVPSASMNPTILEGDRVFINKMKFGIRVPMTTLWLWHYSSPKRGQIVIFFSPEEGKTLVKRVVGVPGDIIRMDSESLVINNKAVSYTPLTNQTPEVTNAINAQVHIFVNEQLDNVKHPILLLPDVPAKRSFENIKVPEGEYFMMGDDRDNSKDSRYIGLISEKEIIGEADTILFSLDSDNPYHLRSRRFLKPLDKY